MPSLPHRSNQPAAPIPPDPAGAVRKQMLAGVLVLLAAVAIGWLAYVIVWQRPGTQRDKGRTAVGAGRLRKAMPPPLSVMSVISLLGLMECCEDAMGLLKAPQCCC